LTIRTDGGLPVVGRVVDGEVVFLPFGEEEGFRVGGDR